MEHALFRFHWHLGLELPKDGPHRINSRNCTDRWLDEKQYPDYEASEALEDLEKVFEYVIARKSQKFMVFDFINNFIIVTL